LTIYLLTIYLFKCMQQVQHFKAELNMANACNFFTHYQYAGHFFKLE
jgi:hypothetical protein